MSLIQRRRGALLYERDALVAERARRLLEAEDFATCWVDDRALFTALRGAPVFDVHLVGVAPGESLDDLPALAGLDPLLLLAPPEASTSYRMVWPRARPVDRALRDPDALASALGTRAAPAAKPDEEDPVRRAFAPFGLSERQLEVLARALTGATGREIAGELFISELTVRNHLHAIYERVGVSGRRELLGRFVRGLMEAGA